jgi:parallel beta-helix repeat protein
LIIISEEGALSKGILAWILLILLAFWIDQSIIPSASSTSSIIRVPEDYPTIQEAVNAAKPGDTVLVGSGTYYESIFIDKPISLIGECKENTTVIGLGIGNVIYISSDIVTVSRFTIKGSGSNYISPFDGGDAGVMLDKCTNCTISNLIVTECCLGIFLNLSNGNVIESNICYSNSKDGIYLRLSNNNTIKDNICYLNGGHAGIYLNPSNSYNIIENNTCYSNADHGIKLQESSNYNILKNNNCTDNENAGIFLRTSNGNILDGNICSRNKHNPGIILHISCNNNTLINNICNLNDEGIALQHSCNNNVLINNTCINNRVRGILLWSSNNNTVIRNTLNLNRKDPCGTAGICLDNSSYNEIYYNNVLMNWRGITITGENSTGNEIHQNNIAKNVEWGLLNDAPKEVNATLNWWGSLHGPQVCQFVEETDSEDPEEIQGNVLYRPWLTTPIEGVIGPKLRVSNLSINPAKSKIGETISISINATNVGDLPGTFTIALKVNGAIEEMKNITLSAGESSIVTFELARDNAGTYTVEVDGLTGSFMVEEATPPWELYTAIILIVMVIVVITVIYRWKIMVE